MANALSNLAASLFNRQPQNNAMNTTAVNPRILGTGMASDAAFKMLMHQYQNEALVAQVDGQEFPSFEEWMAKRGQQ